MFTKTTFTKALFILVALLMCATVLFAACDTVEPFKPTVTIPGTAEPVGNGGLAVQYGDYIYYVNGYQSSSKESNTYTNTVRTAAIVRVKTADLDDIIKINNEDMSSTKKTEAIAAAVKEKVELVVPNYYYSGNTTSTALNGLHILKFGGEYRIFITTPNDELDSQGALLNNQLVLTSYKLDGSDRQRHLVFSSNAPQLKLTSESENVRATYVLDGGLYSVLVGQAQPADPIVKVTSPTFSGDYIYFLDEDGALCQYKIGAEKHTQLVKAKEEGDHDHDAKTLSIVSANGEYVYYKVKDSKNVLSEKELYCAKLNTSGEVETKDVIDALPDGSFFGWNDKIVYTAQAAEESTAMYGVWVTGGDATTKQVILDPAINGSSISFDKLEGNILYYNCSSISYTLDISVAGAVPVAYAASLSTSNTGWAVSDVLGQYVFSVSGTNVSVVKFNPATQKNSPSTTITLKAE